MSSELSTLLCAPTNYASDFLTMATPQTPLHANTTVESASIATSQAMALDESRHSSAEAPQSHTPALETSRPTPTPPPDESYKTSYEHPYWRTFLDELASQYKTPTGPWTMANCLLALRWNHMIRGHDVEGKDFKNSRVGRQYYHICQAVQDYFQSDTNSIALSKPYQQVSKALDAIEDILFNGDRKCWKTMDD